ncbi:MAG: prohibitin family protein [Magnetococcales bacterium]|nr:prohibitin family protein [Magnetococcales bacterium]
MRLDRAASFWRRMVVWLRDHLFVFGTFSLLTILILAFLWPHIFISIHSGEAGVLYRRFGEGTVIDRVFEEGFWILWPWNNMTIYDMRVQAIKHDFTVLSADGLPIHLMLLIRYQPEYATLAVLHQRVGVDYVNKIVVPTVESVIRRSIGRFRQEEIYQTKKGILASIVLLAMQEAGRKYVHMDDVIIRTIQLPESIQQAIEEKLVYEQQLASYQFRLDKEAKEAQRKETEAVGIHKYHEIIGKALDDKMLMWRGIEATKELANSANAKVVVVGAGKSGLPIIGGVSLDGVSASASEAIMPAQVAKPLAVSPKPPETTMQTDPAGQSSDATPDAAAKQAVEPPATSPKTIKRAKGTPESSAPNAKSSIPRSP